MLEENAKIDLQSAQADVSADKTRLQVQDDFDRDFPVTCREVAVIESYLAELIEEILAGGRRRVDTVTPNARRAARQ